MSGSVLWSDAACIAWQANVQRSLIVLSHAEIRWETHWLDGRTQVCPRGKCDMCRYELATQRLGFFAFEPKCPKIRWVNLPFESCERAEPMLSLETLRAAFLEVNKIGKQIIVKCKGRWTDDLPWPAPKEINHYRLIAKLHRLPMPAAMPDNLAERAFRTAAAARWRLCNAG